LKTTLVVKNEDEDTFEFKSLLHTYFHVPVSYTCAEALIFLHTLTPSQ
jgi:D-hexose-6-phosphate mutarotase